MSDQNCLKTNFMNHSHFANSMSNQKNMIDFDMAIKGLNCMKYINFEKILHIIITLFKNILSHTKYSETYFRKFDCFK